MKIDKQLEIIMDKLKDVNYAMIVVLITYLVGILAVFPMLKWQLIQTQHIFFFVMIILCLSLIKDLFKPVKFKILVYGFVFNYLLSPIFFSILGMNYLNFMIFFFIGLPVHLTIKKRTTQAIFLFIYLFFYFKAFSILIEGFSEVEKIDMSLFLYEITIISIYYYSIMGIQNSHFQLNKGLSNKFSKMAVNDELTGLYNRHYLTKLFCEDCREYSLALFDIDKFKNINDIHGHIVGDLVLKKVGELLKELQYSSLSVVRYGGDEFLIIAESMKLSEIASMAENIRLKVCKLEVGGMQKGSISISCGLSEWEEGLSWQSLLANADLGLYLAKEKGRNRVCIKKEAYRH